MRHRTRNAPTTPKKTQAQAAGEETANVPEAHTASKEMAEMASSNLPTDLQNLRTVLVTDMKGVMSDLIQDALSPLKKSLDDVKKTTDSHTTKINELETALSEYSDQVTEMTATCTKLQAENQAFADRVEDAENRARRCNLRIINIPEKAVGTDAVKFMPEFFAEVLGREVYPTPPSPPC